MRVKIEKLIYGGEGLAHAGGATVFVPFVLPGEEVEIEPTEQKKKFIRGKVKQIVVASPQRAEPACRHFRDCGGCDYQHIPYEVQLKCKEEILRETLRRLGQIAWTEPIKVHASPPWGYRNRAQWKVRSPGEGPRQVGPRTATEIGYFRAGSSSLCPIQMCPVLSPTLFETFTRLREAMAKDFAPAPPSEIEAFADDKDENLLLNITGTSLGRAAKPLADKLFDRVSGVKSILFQEAAGAKMELHGPGFLSYQVLGKRLRVGHFSFFQVNRFGIDALAGTVAALAGGGELAFDLYAGVGLFAVMLADRFSRVEAVEENPAAARDLESTAGAAAKNVRARNQSTADFLNGWIERHRSTVPDTVVIDPPRAGLDPETLNRLKTISAQRMIYVSCDPATLARDLKALCPQRYRPEEIHMWDLFPQTYHIETVVRLERNP